MQVHDVNVSNLPADLRELIGLEGLVLWLLEHEVVIDGGEPVGGGGGEIVAASEAITLDEWVLAVLPEARPW